MAYWSIAVLVASISFFVYRHPSQTLDALPAWLRPGRRRALEAGKASKWNGAQAASEIKSSENEAMPSISVEVPVVEEDKEQSTPKANASEGKNPVPTFALHDDGAEEEEPKVPSFPAANSVQRASAMPPPAKPSMANPSQIAPSLMPPPSKSSSSTLSAPSLMAPPALPTPRLQQRGAPPPSSAAGLRAPTTGPLPNRGPPVNSQQRASGGLTANGTALSTPNPRNKVLLSPGHSPMDWAALTRSPGNPSALTGVSTFQRVTPSRLRSMTGRKGKPAWSSWQGKVYNITPYLPFHPGGEAELMKAAGRDGGKLFMEVHPWVNWENMLGSCLVGVMVPAESSPLEEMD